MALLFAAQMWPTVPSPPGALTDKHEHLFFYGILSALLAWALGGGRLHRITFLIALAATAYASIYGVAMEFCQMLVPTRSFDIVDMIADAIGAALAGGCVWAWSIIRRRIKTSDAL
jgi:VanZ family protein